MTSPDHLEGVGKIFEMSQAKKIRLIIKSQYSLSSGYGNSE